MNTKKTGNTPSSGNLSIHEKKSHNFDGRHSASLTSLGQLFDDDWISILGENKINIIKDSKIILKEQQNKSYELWDIPISNPLVYRAHVIITRDKKNTDIIQYLNGCCFRYTSRKFLKAIKNGKFLTWIGLNNQTFLKRIPMSILTVLGNLYQEHNKLQLTKQLKPELDIEENKDYTWVMRNHHPFQYQ